MSSCSTKSLKWLRIMRRKSKPEIEQFEFPFDAKMREGGGVPEIKKEGDKIMDEVNFYAAKSRWDQTPIKMRKGKLGMMQKEKIFAECSFIQLPPDIRTILVLEADHASN